MACCSLALIGASCRTALRVVVAALAVGLTADVCCADTPAGGDSSREARQAAARAVPWERLQRDDRAGAARVVRGASLFRRLPTRDVECDPQLFSLLAARPELVVEVWNLMGISRLTLDPIGPDHYRATDAGGTTGEVRIIHREGGGDLPMRVVALCEGVYHAPPMPTPVTATCLMAFRATPLPPRPGAPTMVRAELDTFVEVDRPAAELVLKTLHPLVARTADHNFVETMRFAALFSRTAERNPAGMLRLAQHLEKIDAPTRERFVAVCQGTAERASLRDDAVEPAAARVAAKRPTAVY